MTPLIVLVVTFAIALLALRRREDPRLAARIALAAMLVVTGVSHFTMTAALAAMVPPFIPWPVATVYATGVLELALAALLLARPGPWLGWLIAVFFLALLPANIYSALADSGYGASGPGYLWFRVPLQLLFIAWALAATGALRWPRRALSPVGRRLPQS